VKAKKSLLIPKEDYARMVLMEIPQIGRWLGETQYIREINELSKKFSDVNLIENATYTNLARTYNDILSFSKGKLKEILSEYLKRWDIWNIKTILRGKLYGAKKEEIAEDLIPAGSFKTDFLDALIESESIDKIIDKTVEKFADTPSYDRLVDAGNELKRTKSLMVFEDALDRAYYTNLQDKIRARGKPNRMFLDFVKKEIDIINIKLLFELKHEGLSTEKINEFLLPGGLELTEKKLKHLSSSESFKQFVSELRGYSFYEDIKNPIAEIDATNSISSVILALDKHLLKFADRFSHIRPLSVLPILSYLLMKKKEVDNIRIICRGKEFELGDEDIKNLLVV
jgi:V/A-type H+-transporting ATPase subunit C